MFFNVTWLLTNALCVLNVKALFLQPTMVVSGFIIPVSRSVTLNLTVEVLDKITLKNLLGLRDHMNLNSHFRVLGDT
jgi:hypothetical protein